MLRLDIRPFFFCKTEPNHAAHTDPFSTTFVVRKSPHKLRDNPTLSW